MTHDRRRRQGNVGPVGSCWRFQSRISRLCGVELDDFWPPQGMLGPVGDGRRRHRRLGRGLAG
jgi:hypothetical protein